MAQYYFIFFSSLFKLMGT